MSNKIKSMCEFVDMIHEDYMKTETAVLDAHMKIVRYKEFLQTPLSLGQFVPCEEDSKPLSEPPMKFHADNYKDRPLVSEGWDSIFYREKREYEEAKSKVIFIGCKAVPVKDYFIVFNNQGHEIWLSYTKRSIEHLTNKHMELTDTKALELGLI